MGPDETQLRNLIVRYASQYVGSTISNTSLRSDLTKYNTGFPTSGNPQWCAYFSIMCWVKAFSSFQGGEAQTEKIKKAFSPSTKSMIYGWEDDNSSPTINGFFRASNTYNVNPIPEPKPGDMIFFRRPEYIRDPGVNKDNPNSYSFKKQTTQDGKGEKLYNVLKTSGHVGIVEYVEKNAENISVIHTIEGNTTGKDDNGNQATGGVVARKPGLLTKGNGVTFPKEYWIHRNYFGIVAIVSPVLDPTASFVFGDQIVNTSTGASANSNAGKRFTLGEADFTSLVNIDFVKLVNKV